MRILLGPFLGHVEPDSVVLWLRTEPATDAAGAELTVTARPVHGSPARATAVPLVTRAATGGTGAVLVPLAGGPARPHDLTLTRGGQVLSRLRVASAPAPSRDGAVAFAFASCWKPTPGRDPAAAWRIIAALARTGYVQHLLLLGDQVYADESPLPGLASPWPWSPRTATARVLAMPADATAAQRLEPFRALYQHSWEWPETHAALSLLPATLAWDDHEIVNGFGSAPWHDEAPGRRLFAAAAQAFDEFQGARNPPPLVEGSRGHAFRRGPAAFLTLDLRTHRNAAAARVLGDEQKRAVETYLLGEARESALLFVACSVPPLHLPLPFKPLRRITDVVDQWSSWANLEERRWLLGLVREYEEGGLRRAVILGGDAHLATVASLEDGRGRKTWQLTSSPLAHRPPPYVIWALTLLGDRFHVPAGEEVLTGSIHRRWKGANVGVVRGRVDGGRSTLTFEIFRPGRRTELIDLT